MRDSGGRFVSSQGKDNANYRHGMFGTPVYRAWHNMLQRCTNPHNKSFVNYGARGIGVCERWRSFKNFHADMGNPPIGMTIERLDNHRDYEPGNCQWASRTVQARNSRHTKLTFAEAQVIRASHESYTVLGKRYGVTKQTIYGIKKGKTWKEDE